MECCNQKMSIFGLTHYYCQRCNRHYYKNKWYTAEEWFFYVNGITFQEYQRKLEEQQLMEAGNHSHELINHSNPEI